MQLERSRRVTDLAVAALAEAGVIRPWQIKLKTKRAGRTGDWWITSHR